VFLPPATNLQEKKPHKSISLRHVPELRQRYWASHTALQRSAQGVFFMILRLFNEKHRAGTEQTGAGTPLVSRQAISPLVPLSPQLQPKDASQAGSQD